MQWLRPRCTSDLQSNAVATAQNDRKPAGLGHELPPDMAPRSTNEERWLSFAVADLPPANDPKRQSA